MTKETWAAVDEYFGQAFGLTDPVLEAALADQDRAGLRSINVSPHQGALLAQLVRLTGGKRVLEIGTLAGYSAIWMGRALAPDGRLITLEFEPLHAEVARKNLDRAGLSDKVEIRVGDGLAALAHLYGPFDLVFIDADKRFNLEYFLGVVPLTRSGGLIVTDNVVRKGEVLDSSGTDDKVVGVRRLRDHLATETRVQSTLLQTVGSKGHDGMILSVVA